MTNEETKLRTLALYDQLSQDKEERIVRVDIRDQVIDLNYNFFGYVAKNTYVNNPSVTYEDKLQTALCCFLDVWWWYRWEERYRTDLSFAVFYKLRLSEMVQRSLNEVKYSISRTLCTEAGNQLGKHWRQVRYEDLANVKLPFDKMNSLKAMFGSIYWADITTQELYKECPIGSSDIEQYQTTMYNTIEELLIQEMIYRESPLDNKDLLSMSDMYSIPVKELQDKLPEAMKILYARLKRNQDIFD